MREVLAEIAKEEWTKETSSNVDSTCPLPLLMDGRNSRSALSVAQLSAPQTYGIIVQLRSELAGKDLRQGATQSAPPLKPTERELYRLHPLDDVLERRVPLAACSIWGPWYRIVWFLERPRQLLGGAGCMSSRTRRHSTRTGQAARHTRSCDVWDIGVL